ncbi:MAG: protein kinase [Gemmatimonadetes bacterium]|nr:protein kinase [Gemmatimonadota bacterium]
MTSDLQSRLQGAVGGTYRVERELGGGGMSRVFLAEETELGRKVVIKVLPPEMAAGVNVDRFRREIQLAARLQHPHVVQLLTAGASGDLLYYIMPFIQGESLRAKLAREGELPIPEAARILREVVDALAYAHRHGVVHRDIKPDNVLLSEGHAVVTDFGVAKAVSEATGSGMSLTSLGVALGTPAYMAPEQAVADPHVDHRADIYAVGILAYEMVCGRLPFSAGTPQALLAAHVTEAPEPATRHRTTVPEALNALIMRCLEKKAADRWQRAEELLPHLDAVLTPTGGITPTGTQPHPAVTVSDAARAYAQAHPARVAALFAVSSAVVLFVVYAVVQLAGLPDWVFYGAIALLAVGLPIMLLTGRHERQRAVATMAGTPMATPTGVQRHFTWRKALIGGGLAFAGLTVVAGGYMAMRLFGIGPVGSLVASGVLADRERIVLAEFENLTQDSTLGQTVTELFRIDLTQSPTVTVLEDAQVRNVLRRMQQPADARVTHEVAADIAAREGLKAILSGELRALGSGFVLSAQLVAAGTGEVLWAGRENAVGADQLSVAIDKLSASVRERIGESLRTIRADAPLDQVTTSSLEALQLYAQADRANNNGDIPGAMALLDRAIALDSNFAMAYRKLGVHLSNTGLDPERMKRALTKGYELRSKLTDRERYLAEAMYSSNVAEDPDATIVAYQALLEKYPSDRTALNNLANEYAGKNRLAEAVELHQRAIASGGAPAVTYQNAVARSYSLGQVDTARQLLAKFAADYPANPNVRTFAATIVAAERDWDSAQVLYQAARAERRGNALQEIGPVFSLANLAAVRGKVTESRALVREGQRLAAQAGLPFARLLPSEEIRDLNDDAVKALLIHGDPGRAVRLLQELLRRDPPTRYPADQRPYLGYADAFARAGRVDLANDMVRRWEAEVADSATRQDPGAQWHNVRGMIALTEGRLEDALAARRRAKEKSPGCGPCNLFDFAEIHDRAGRPDSAIAYYEQWVNAKDFGRLGWDSGLLWRARRRVGELYEARGDRERALAYYSDLLEQWKNADAELQPILAEVKARMGRLAGEGRQ